MLLGPKCRREGCTENRTRFSVFCEGHHREQLGQVGGNSPDPCVATVKGYVRIVNAFTAGAITQDEMVSQLFDRFVYIGLQGLERCWAQGFRVLSPEVIIALRDFVRNHPSALLFRSGPVDAAAQEKALATQATLLRTLEGCVDQRID